MVRRRLALVFAVIFATLPFAARAQTASATVSTDEKKPSGPTFTPYGFILVNSFFSSRPFAADDYPQYALAAPSATNDRGILLSTRYNRIGVRIGGLEGMGAKLGAVLEMDFGFGFVIPAGSNTNQSVQETNFDFYKPIARMRLGYATATWDAGGAKVTLLLGQDYGLVNPLFAVTLAYIGTPLFQNAGNLYTRSPGAQLRADFGKDAGGTIAVAVLNPMDQNGLPVTVIQNQETPTLSSGNRSRIPQLEGRVVGRAKTDVVSAEIGVAGQYHKERYAKGTFTTIAAGAAPAFAANGQFLDIDSMLGGVDAVIKLPFVELRGEGFMGHNFDNYFAHLGQGGVNAVTTTAGAVTTLRDVTSKRDKGFWAQAIVTPIQNIQLLGGYGVETPFRQDVPNVAGNRVRNSVAHAGIILAASKNLKFSAEGAYTYTTTRSGSARSDVTINGYQTALSGQLTF
jgi:hypothetical protein